MDTAPASLFQAPMSLPQLHGAAIILSLMGSHDDADSLFFGQEYELVPPRMTRHTVSERQTTALLLPAQVDTSEAWRHETRHAREIIQAVKPTGTPPL